MFETLYFRDKNNIVTACKDCLKSVKCLIYVDEKGCLSNLAEKYPYSFRRPRQYEYFVPKQAVRTASLSERLQHVKRTYFMVLMKSYNYTPMC